MAEETKPVVDDTADVAASTPSADDTAVAVAQQVEAARTLLLSQGHQVLDSSAFHGIKTQAAEKAESKYAEAVANLEAVRAENQQLADYKAKIENKGKSDSELHAEQRAAWKAQDEARQQEVDTASSALETAKAALATERVQNRIATLMPNSTNTEAAQMWASKHIGKMLSTDEAGQLVWTDPTGTPHIGVAAEKLVSDWWADDSQKFLRAGNVPGPPTGGAAAAPAAKPDRYVNNPSLTFDENLRAADAWQKQHGA